MKTSFVLAQTRTPNRLLCSNALVLAAACLGTYASAQQLPPNPSDENATAVAAVQGSETDAGTAPSPSIYHLYVATTGNDANTGSSASPFRTINKAATVAKPSTTIHVAAGTYTGNVSTKAAGTAAGRIRYVSDVKWGAKIVGTGKEAHWTNSGNFVDVADFDISGPGRLGILNNASHTLISGNHVHDLKLSGGCNGSGGAGIVDASYSASDDDIVGNVVHDIGVPGKCNGVQGIYHSNLRGKIMNNIVYRVSAWGIHLWHAANNVVVANNTVFANGSSGMGGGIEIGSGDSPGGIVVKNTQVVNNIVYNNPGASITQYCYAGHSCIGSGNVTANNLVYGNGRGISLRTGSASGTISADPKFVNYQANGSGNYRLQAGSPAANKGSIGVAPAYDIEGTARSLGGLPDVGAYESF